MKKLISVILVLVIVVGLCGCGGKKVNISYERSSDPVTITYHYQAAGDRTYIPQIEEKLNEILKSIKGYENITISLQPYFDDYQRDFTLAQTAGKQIDIVQTYNLPLSTNIKNGDFIELDDLLKKFPNIAKDIPDWVMDYGKLFGKQYYVPSYQQASNLSFIVMPTDYLNMYLDYNSTTREKTEKLIQKGSVDDKLDFMEDLCLAVRESTGLDSKWLFTGEFWDDNLISDIFFNQEYIEDTFDNWILREGDDAPVYWGYTDEYKTVMERFSQWYKDGLLHPEVTTVNYYKFAEDNFLNDESYVCLFEVETCDEEYLEKYLTDLYGVEMSAIRVTDHAYIPSQWGAGGQAIYADCEHPVEAMMIIELLRSEMGEEFYNTLVFGLEGIHWQWKDKEKKQITTLEYDASQAEAGATYGAYKWSNGNVIDHAWRNQAVRDGYYDYIVNEVNEGKNTVKSPAMGITWDLSSVYSKFSQCQVVEKEYANTIYISDDWEARYNEYISKLETAGVQDVLDVLKKQFNDFKKSKK